MRITNKIIQNNSLNNINGNKILQDKLSTQLSTEKKIARPSDDPIIALRSLRLRTSVNQTDQYLNKNVEDAESWLTVTEDAIKTLSDIITDVRKQYTKGTSDTLASSDRQIILENLESLAAEIYNTGNVDFAGRSVFTGYRTDTTLTFQKDENVTYKIWEEKENLTLDQVSYVHTDDLETDVYSENITRIRLSYQNLDDTAGSVSLKLKVGGTETTITPEIKALDSDPYEYVAQNPTKCAFVPETGEVLIGASVGNPDTITDYSVSYDKTAWNKGDLRPEHYFKCKDNDNNIEYNYNSSPEGEICYNIGVNQSLRINTTAGECFTHNVVRDIQDAIRALKEVDDIEKRMTDLKAERDGLNKNDTAGIKAVQDKIDAAEKAQTFLNEKLHKLMSSGISKADEYLAANNLALTNCGTRSKRLELIQNRLTTQLSSLKELKSENEDVDMAEAAIQFSSAKYAYDASLMATSKTVQQSLLNYL